MRVDEVHGFRGGRGGTKRRASGGEGVKEHS